MMNDLVRSSYKEELNGQHTRAGCPTGLHYVISYIVEPDFRMAGRNVGLMQNKEKVIGKILALGGSGSL